MPRRADASLSHLPTSSREWKMTMLTRRDNAAVAVYGREHLRSALLLPLSLSLTVRLRSFAMTSTLAGAVGYLASSLLAFWAYSYVKTLSTIIAAEDEAHSNVLSNVKLVSLGASFHCSRPARADTFSFRTGPTLSRCGGRVGSALRHRWVVRPASALAICCPRCLLHRIPARCMGDWGWHYVLEWQCPGKRGGGMVSAWLIIDRMPSSPFRWVRTAPS